MINNVIGKLPKGLLSMLTLALIAYASLDADPFDAHRIRLFEGSDKVVHCIMYCFLSLALMVDVAKVKCVNLLNVNVMSVCSIVAFAYSVTMEYLQGMMNQGRSASIGDVVANMIGVILGFVIMRSILKKNNTNRNINDENRKQDSK